MPIKRIDIGSGLSPQEKIQRARYQLAIRNPFLGTLLYEFPIVLSRDFDDCPTAYIDFERRVIVINECFVNALTIPELMQVIAHEVFHVIQYAHERAVEIGAKASPLDWELWNIATDYIDNLTLQDFGIGKMPDVYLDETAPFCRYYNKEGRGEKLRFYIDERFRGWTAEEIFIWMKKYGITKKIGPLTRVIVPLPTNCPVCGGSGRVQDPQTGTSTGCPVCGGTGKVPSFQPPKRPCPTCGGTGKITKPDGTEGTCPTCGGTGEVLGAPQPIPQPQRCPTCDGSGRTPCPTCGGSGSVTEPTTGQKEPCPTCGGSGTVTCPTCDGEGEVVPCPTCGGSGSVEEPGTGEAKPCPTCGGSGVVPPHKIPPEAIPPPSPLSGVEGEDYVIIDQFDLPPRGSGREGRPGKADVEKNRDSVGRSWGTARTPGWERIVEEVLRPALPWKVLLERFIRQSAKVDYRWTPPSKKTYPHGIILPGLAGEKLTAVIAVDSSSSITDQEFQWFVSETLAILNSFEAVEAWIIVCDNEIKGVQRILCRGQRVDPSIWRGGGGTCFRPVFEFVKEKGIRPDVLIYFTDLECYDKEYCYPDFIPSYPVLWVWVHDAGVTHPQAMPPFGTVIEYRRPRVV